MTTTTTSVPGQDPAAGTPGQGQDPAGQQDPQHGDTGGQAGQDPAGPPTQFDLSTIQDPALRTYLETQAAELRRARDEAARFRTERVALAEQVQQHQRQQETDAERVQREAAELRDRYAALEQENRTLKVGTALNAAAAAAKAHNPARVAALLDGDVETDDKGNPTNVDVLLKALRASDPYLFAPDPAGADAGAGARRPNVAPTRGVGDNVNQMLRAARGVR